VSAVKSGLGIAPLPTTLGNAEDILVQVLGPVPELTRSWYVLTHPNMRHKPRIAAFIDHVIKEIPNLRSVLIG
jgi:DNA-binding transcriptional LysR family regulator